MANISNVKVLAGNQVQVSGSSVQLTGSGASVTVSSSQIILTGTVSASGDVFVAGRLTANEFHTLITTASVIYQSGSTKFGDDPLDNHQFTGSVFVTGALSASSFTGSGAGLTGVVTSLVISPSNNLSASGTSGAITIALSESLSVTSVTASNTVSASVGKFTTLSASNAEFSGNILIYGTASLANADAAYVRYVSSIDRVRVFPGLDVSGSSTISGNLNVTGSVSASIFTGSGAGLTNLPATSLTGIVPLANGGTGINASAVTSGKLLIGSGSAFSLGNLLAGSGVTIQNGTGSITINATGSGGTVTSVSAGDNIVVVSGSTTPIVSLSASLTGLTNVSSSNLTASAGLLAGGTFVVQARTVTSAHTIDSVTQDHVVFADAISGSVTVTLVNANTKGRQLVVKKVDTSVNTVTVSGSVVSGTIDSAANFQLNGPFQSITLVADGTSNWFIV
jgi:hypothetical protein